MKSWMFLLALIVILMSACLSAKASAQNRVVFLRLEELLPGEVSDSEEDLANAWVSDLDGRNQVKITSSHWVRSARWLDERTIAVISSGDIWLVPLDARPKTRLTQSHITSLACSRDGQTIFFSEYDRNSRVSIYRMERNGQGRRRLVELGDCAFPLLTTAQDRLFYIERGNDEITIVSCDLEGQARQILARFPRDPTIEIFSLVCDRKGQQVVFTRFFHLIKGDNPRNGSSLEMVETQTQRLTTICLLYSQGCFGCSFVGDSEIIFNDGGRGELRRMTIGAKKKTKVPIVDAIDPDIY